MKCLKRIFTIIICFVMISFVTGCSKKKISIEKFNEIMKEKGYKISDDIKLDNEEETVKKYSIVNDPDNKYMIQFYQFDSHEDAKLVYHKMRLELYSIPVKGSTSGSIERKKYYKFVLTNDDKYYIVSVIDNTLLFAYTKVENKNELKNFVKKIGY